VGKLPTEQLQKLLKCIRKSPSVIVPPLPGFDSGVHLIGQNECLVVSTDPCVGVPEKWFGWLLIHYAASDVALFGAKPEFCTIALLGPISTSSETFTRVMKQACIAADELEIAVVTGHTGSYDGISDLVGICTAYGRVSRDKLITPKGSKAGDSIVCTRQIGLETVVNFSLTHKSLSDHLFTAIRTRELQNLINMQTCVKEATLLAESAAAHAMHDATEGGLVAALNEMAEASGLGFEVDFEKLPFLKETQILQEYFGLSTEELLSLSSTGTLLASIDPGKASSILQHLRSQDVEASIIGSFTKDKKRLIQRQNTKLSFPKIAEDPYAKIMLAR
jgi:hydrogenase expression/formation protein HypE